MSGQVVGQLPSVWQKAGAVLAHALPLPGFLLFYGAGSFVLPLLYLLAFGKSAPLVDHHARASANTAFTVSLLMLALHFLSLRPQSHLAAFAGVWVVFVGWFVVSVARMHMGSMGRDLHVRRWAWIR